MMRPSLHSPWLVTVVSILTLVLALTACGPAPDPTIGHLVGVVFIRGGTIKTAPAEAAVTATSKGSDTNHTYTIETASDGSFSLSLPQGTYELTGTLTKRSSGLLTTPQDVTIMQGETTRVELYVLIP